MKSLFKFGQFGLLVGLLAVLLLQPTLAVTEPTTAVKEDIKTGTQKIEQNQDTLSTIEKDEKLSPVEKTELGINARRGIVLDALTLSLNEVNSIKGNLVKLPEFEEVSREKEVQDKFFLEIEDFKKHYSEKFDEVTNNTNPTLDEIRATAQELIDYRETVYNPAVKKIVDFTLFFYNKEVITAVNSYLERISADIKKFENVNILKTDLFKAELDQVAILIQSATDLQKTAGELILAEPKEISVNEIEVIEEVLNINETDGVEGDEEIETVIDPNILITESLNKVRSSYEILLEIISGMRKSLGVR